MQVKTRQGSAALDKGGQYKSGQRRVVLGLSRAKTVQVKTRQGSAALDKGGQYKSGQRRVVLG